MKLFTLLRKISDSDYQSLIDQVELANKGYDFYFAVDADLIGNYCYPKGIIPEEKRNERSSKLSADYLSDEQITLHTIFNLKDNHKNLLLFDQYFYEVEGMLYKATKKGKNEIKNLDIEFPIFKLDSNTNEFLLELFYNSFSDMFAKVLLNVSGLKKATSILNEKKIILDTRDLDYYIDKQLSETGRASKHDTEIVSENMLHVLNNGKVEEHELFESKKRDAIIIDRILSFNRPSITPSNEPSGNPSKNIIILLSDSSLMKDTLIRIKDCETRIKYPKINGKELLFYRDVPQSFAYTICLTYDRLGQIDYDKTLKNLNELREASLTLDERFKNTTEKLARDHSEFLSDSHFQNYNKLVNAFENSGLLKAFDQLYESIKKYLSEIKIEDVANVFDALIKEGNNLIKEVETKHLYFLKTLIKIGEFNSAFIYGIDRIEHENATFDISKGADYVEGSDHHLPLFLTFSNTGNDYKSHMAEIIRLVIQRSSDDSKLLCNRLESILKVMNASKIHELEKTDINLIKAFIFMILPSLNTIRGIKENDIMANSWLKELTIQKDDTEAICNKLYLEIWSYRRIKQYRESLKIAKQAIVDYPSDPRFYHGLLLAQYCLLEESKNKNMSLLDSMINNLQNAYNLYSKFIIDNFDNQPITSLMIESINHTYYNSFSYCLALKANLLEKTEDNNEYIDLLIESRSIFKKLKDENGKYFIELPEYYDTEAFIEYLESFYIESSLRIDKLKNAKTAINRAIELTNNVIIINKYNNILNQIKYRIEHLEKN